MGKYDVSLEQLGLDDLVASHPVTVATTFEPPPVRQPVVPKPLARPVSVQADPYASLCSYIAWLGPLGKWGHYLSAGAILVSLVQDSAGLLAFGVGGLMLSIVAFAVANLLRIALDAKDSLDKFRS